jgi:hypothetical protein
MILSKGAAAVKSDVVIRGLYREATAQNRGRVPTKSRGTTKNRAISNKADLPGKSRPESILMTDIPSEDESIFLEVKKEKINPAVHSSRERPIGVGLKKQSGIPIPAQKSISNFPEVRTCSFIKHFYSQHFHQRISVLKCKSRREFNVSPCVCDIKIP